MCFVCIDFVFFFKQKTAYEMRISDWSSDVCSSDLSAAFHHLQDRLSNRRPSRHAGGENRTHPAGRPARSCSGPRRSGAARGGHFQGRHRTVADTPDRSEEHTSELQSLMRISYAVFCLKKKNNHTNSNTSHTI